jgi:hypothetical protein
VQGTGLRLAHIRSGCSFARGRRRCRCSLVVVQWETSTLSRARFLCFSALLHGLLISPRRMRAARGSRLLQELRTVQTSRSGASWLTISCVLCAPRIMERAPNDLGMSPPQSCAIIYLVINARWWCTVALLSVCSVCACDFLFMKTLFSLGEESEAIGVQPKHTHRSLTGWPPSPPCTTATPSHCPFRRPPIPASA